MKKDLEKASAEREKFKEEAAENLHELRKAQKDRDGFEEEARVALRLQTEALAEKEEAVRSRNVAMEACKNACSATSTEVEKLREDLATSE